MDSPIKQKKIITIKQGGTTCNSFSKPSYGLDDTNLPFKPSKVRVISSSFYDNGSNTYKYLLYCPQICQGPLCLVNEATGMISYNDYVKDCFANAGYNRWDFKLLYVDDTVPGALNSSAQLVVTLEFQE